MLQVILHLIQDNPWDIFNDNREGEILSDIMKYASISQLSYKEQGQLKRTLCHYNDLFSGYQQQDAHACYLLFVDIIHQGSKYSVLDPQENYTKDSKVFFWA